MEVEPCRVPFPLQPAQTVTQAPSLSLRVAQEKLGQVPVVGLLDRRLCGIRQNCKTSVASAPALLYSPPCFLTMREWRNWYTRKTKDLVPQGLGVRVPPRAPLSKEKWKQAELQLEFPE